MNKFSARNPETAKWYLVLFLTGMACLAIWIWALNDPYEENSVRMVQSAITHVNVAQNATSGLTDDPLCSLESIDCVGEAKTVLTTCYTSRESRGTNGRNPWSVATRMYPRGTHLWIEGFGEKVVETVHNARLSDRVDIWAGDDYDWCMKYGKQYRKIRVIQ